MDALLHSTRLAAWDVDTFVQTQTQNSVKTSPTDGVVWLTDHRFEVQAHLGV